jgi:hypothetical protein
LDSEYNLSEFDLNAFENENNEANIPITYIYGLNIKSLNDANIIDFKDL